MSSLHVTYRIRRLTIGLAGEDDWGEGQNLSCLKEIVTFARRTDLIEGR